jgi:hypothetical protein
VGFKNAHSRQARLCCWKEAIDEVLQLEEEAKRGEAFEFLLSQSSTPAQRKEIKASIDEVSIWHFSLIIHCAFQAQKQAESSWKKTSGRTGGSDQYQFGDLFRSVLRRLESKQENDFEVEGLKNINIDDSKA